MDDMVKKLQKLLEAHDWTFEMSDDSRCWSRGLAQAKEIRLVAAKVDYQLAKRMIDKYAGKPGCHYTDYYL